MAIVDQQSTNGVLVNGQRVTEQELADGDMISIGEFTLTFGHAADLEEQPLAAAPETEQACRTSGPVISGDGPLCPCCQQVLAPTAKVCIGCGIYVKSGRPLLLSKGMDEDALYVRAETWIKLLSWIVVVTPLPIPLASEAYGKHKPYAIWGIALLTALISVAFYLGASGERGWNVPGKQYMLWPDNTQAAAVELPPGVSDVRLTDADVKQALSQMDAEERAQFEAAKRKLRGKVPDRELDRRALESMIDQLVAGIKDELRVSMNPGRYQPHQLLTHAFLHDYSSILGLAMHLGGNLLFMLVFGTRVNSLIGNIATLILYPLLAIGAGLVHLSMSSGNMPMLGASGAIQGLAGLYLILFPAQRVFCAMWIRIRLWMGMKIFTLRGFWVLLLYFVYDAAMAHFKAGGTTAHWAHIGGFVTGMTIALGLLCSRLFNCGGGDLLSVGLGKYAWPLIGKPARWNASAASARSLPSPMMARA